MLFVAFVTTLYIHKIYIAFVIIKLLSSENQEVTFPSYFHCPSVFLKALTPFYLAITMCVHDMSQMVSCVGVSFVAFSCGGKQTGVRVILIFESWLCY